MKTHNRQPGQRDDSKRLLTYWQERISQIPDTSLAKVLRVRRAVITDYYEKDAILNKAIRRIQKELNALRREENLGTC